MQLLFPKDDGKDNDEKKPPKWRQVVESQSDADAKSLVGRDRVIVGGKSRRVADLGVGTGNEQ